MGVGAEGDAEGAGEAEVADFEVAVFVDEEVLGFEIAVKDAVGVAVADARDELVGEFLDLGWYSVSVLSCSRGIVGVRIPCLLPDPSVPCPPCSLLAMACRVHLD